LKKLEKKTIQRVATNTIGYTRKQAKKEWFDVECANVNVGKKRRQRASHPNQNQECLQTSPDKKKGVSSEKKQGSSTKRFQLRLSDIRVFKTLVNIISA
jgi:hypothetical protein